MMKKTEILILPLVAAVTMLTACSQGSANAAPELRGVSDIACLVNTSVDLLDGVAALDPEDGDITPDLVITVTPHADVENGWAVFTQAGEYEVCYEIRDSAGKLARTTAFASVTEREVYKSDLLTNGFSLSAGGRVKILKDGLSGGIYSFSAEDCEIAEDLKLIREYTLICGEEYTFRYYYNSDAEGRIKIAADGAPFAERQISAGENVTEFTYSLPYKQTADGETASENAKIELWLGGLGDSVGWELEKAETEYTRTDGDYKEVAPDFDFNGKIIDRFDGTQGRTEVADGGRGATLEITQESADAWRGGMFVNTGVPLEDGETYNISFDLASENQNPFEVCIQRSQWGPDEFVYTFTNPDTLNRNSVEISINGRTKGSLWLYVQSGNYKNKITISNLSVKVKQAGVKKETFEISGFSTNNFGGGAGSVTCENGKAVYSAASFGTDWGNNELGSPVFGLSGAAGNFVITFKAKASQRLSVVFAATLADNWDTFVRQKPLKG